MLKKQEGSHILTRIVSLLDFISLHQLQLHKNHAAGTFHTQYTAYQKHQCHRCDAPTSPPLIRDFFSVDLFLRKPLRPRSTPAD